MQSHSDFGLHNNFNYSHEEKMFIRSQKNKSTIVMNEIPKPKKIYHGYNLFNIIYKQPKKNTNIDVIELTVLSIYLDK